MDSSRVKISLSWPEVMVWEFNMASSLLDLSGRPSPFSDRDNKETPVGAMCWPSQECAFEIGTAEQPKA